MCKPNTQPTPGNPGIPHPVKSRMGEGKHGGVNFSLKLGGITTTRMRTYVGWAYSDPTPDRVGTSIQAAVGWSKVHVVNYSTPKIGQNQEFIFPSTMKRVYSPSTSTEHHYNHKQVEFITLKRKLLWPNTQSAGWKGLPYSTGRLGKQCSEESEGTQHCKTVLNA